MRFHRTSLAGLWVIELQPGVDERGSFTRTFCAEEFAAHGLVTRWAQASVSRSARRGTIRGLHWQAEPHPEVKLIRCSAGSVWDVIVDVRPRSPTFGRWHAEELSAAGNRQLYVAAGLAHGFQTLADGSELVYAMSEAYRAELARGLRFDDPDLAISWPIAASVLSDRDRALPTLREAFPDQGAGQD